MIIDDMGDVMLWFVRLVKKDMELFEVDAGDKRKLLKIILQRMEDG